MKNLRCLFIVFILIAQVSFAGTITPNWSWDIPTEADPTDWDGRYEAIFLGIDGIIPKGTSDYQSAVWDNTQGKWVVGTTALLSYVRSGIALRLQSNAVGTQHSIAMANAQFYPETGITSGTNNNPWRDFYSKNCNIINNDGNPQLTISHTPGAIESSWQTDAAGITTLETSGSVWKINGAIHAPETATPTAVSGYFSVYTKSDDMLYYQDGAGNEYQIARKVSVPATVSDTCTVGDYAVESGFRYECVATNTWQRVALTTW